MILEETKILKVSETADSVEDIQNLLFAADIIKKGGLVVFPTETVYGLGANALDENAAAKIYKAKGRPQNNPLIIHLDNKYKIQDYCNTQGIKDLDKLTDLMPAPLTVILPAKDIVPKTVTGGLDTVAVRVPESKIARALINFAGVPIAAPSANLSGKPSPTCIKHVIEDMYGRADVIIDGGDCEVGLESTIVTLCTETPTLLRPGGVTYENLCELLGKVEISKAVLESLKPTDTVLSPGMMYKHYAPEKPVVLVKGTKEKCVSYVNDKVLEKKCVVICYDDDAEHIKCESVLSAGSRNDNSEYAYKLFSLLRDTNVVDAEIVYAFLPEDTKGISLAIYNRLFRAAGFNIVEL